MRFLYLVILAFAFLGCETKNPKHFEISKIKEQALIQSKKQELFVSNNRVLLIATYLNPIKNKHVNPSKEQILINIYITKSKKVQLEDARINAKKASIKKINANSDLAKMSPNYSKWSKYFLIQAPKTNSRNLNLKIKIHSSEFSLDFPREALN